jgi:hypothetical protein
MAIASDKEEEFLKIKSDLASSFKSDNGPLFFHLGVALDVNQTTGTTSLSNETYTQTLLADYNMLDCSPAETPLEHSTLSKRDCPEIGSEEWHHMQKVPYRQCVGQLASLMRTSPADLAYAVGVVSRFMHNPGYKHWQAVKRILRYLKKYPSLPLT